MNKILFDKDWSYFKGDYMPFSPFPAQIEETRWKPVDLPHDALIGLERAAGNSTGMAEGYTQNSMLYYRKKFTALHEWSDKKILIEFDGIFMNAEVIINGNHVAFHPNGYTGFLVDLTKYIKTGQENELVVTVNNLAKPNSRWYSGAGIYRHVYLRICNLTYIEPWSMKITSGMSNAGEANVNVKATIVNENNCTRKGYLNYRIKRKNSDMDTDVEFSSSIVEIALSDKIEVESDIAILDPVIWDIESPNLYTLQYQWVSCVESLESEMVEEEGEETFGIRTLSFDSEKGFQINGRTVKLKGGCIHHDHGPLGAASYDDAEERKLRILKKAGYQAIRSSHNPPSNRFLELCDELGILVINEAFDGWHIGKVAHDYHIHFADWWQRDMKAMIDRDYNHPSVIIHSVGNEVAERDGSSNGYQVCRELADYARSLDPTRPTMVASNAIFVKAKEGEDSNWAANIKGNVVDKENDIFGEKTAPFFDAVDISGYNYLTNRYRFDKEKYPKRVIVGSETYPHEIYKNWTEMLSNNNVIGDFVWTAYDYLGESGVGKVEYDIQEGWGGAYPWFHANCGDFDICGFKRPQSHYRDILWGLTEKPYIGVYHPSTFNKKILFKPWGWEPVLESFTFPGYEGRQTMVDIYSPYEEVELIVNGVSYGKQKAGAANQNKASFVITYHAGSIRAAAYQDNVKVNESELHTVGAPQRIHLTMDYAGEQLIYIIAEIADSNGNRVIHCTDSIGFECGGDGILFALGNGDATSTESFTGLSRCAYNGRLLAIVKRTGNGPIYLKATSLNLTGAELELSDL